MVLASIQTSASHHTQIAAIGGGIGIASSVFFGGGTDSVVETVARPGTVAFGAIKAAVGVLLVLFGNAVVGDSPAMGLFLAGFGGGTAVSGGVRAIDAAR